MEVGNGGRHDESKREAEEKLLRTSKDKQGRERVVQKSDRREASGCRQTHKTLGGGAERASARSRKAKTLARSRRGKLPDWAKGKCLEQRQKG